MNLQPHQVSRFLAERLGTEPTDLEVLTGGHWSQAFGFVLGDQQLVVRFGKYGEDYAKDRAASRFTTPGLPIPEVLELGEAFEGYYCLSRRARGTFLEELDAPGMRQIVPAVMTALDRIREIDLTLWEAEVGPSQGSWVDQLLSVDEENDRVFGWHDAMAESPTGVEPYQRALNFLRSASTSLPDAQNLVHNDLLHCNVLVSGGQINAVFDWGNAGRGDFLYELALFTFYKRWYPAMTAIDWAEEAQKHYAEIGLDVPEFASRMRCFECHIGLGGMAYSAFQRNWTDLADHADRTMQLLEM